MHLRNKTDQKKKTQSVGSLATQAKRLISAARLQEQNQEYSEAYVIYRNAAAILETAGDAKWTRADFILLMDIYRSIMKLIEDDLLTYHQLPGDDESQHIERVRNANANKLILYSKRAQRIYKNSPAIENTEFCLTAIRASLAMSGHCWHEPVFNNDAIPCMLPDQLERIAALLEKVILRAKNENVDNDVADDRIYSVGCCYLALASGYLRLSDIEAATCYVVKALLLGLQAAKKDFRYFDLLSVGFNHLHCHVNFHEDYAVVNFARRLFHYPCLSQPTFSDLYMAHAQLVNKKEIVFPQSLQLAKLIFNIIQERLDAGAFSLDANARYLADFPDGEFRTAMSQPYYQQRFASMREVLLAKEYINPLSLPMPQAVPALSAEPEVMYPASLISGLMMNSCLFSPTLRRNLSRECCDVADRRDEFVTPTKDSESQFKRQKN